jgi:uncharacterized protein DUF6184
MDQQARRISGLGSGRQVARGFTMVLALAALSACPRREEKSALTRPVDGTALRGGIGVPSAAVEAIVGRRCDAAQRCARIGPGKRYVRRVDCDLAVRAEWADELNRVACPQGVREGQLAACLRGLEAESCAELDATERRPECRAAAICDPAPSIPPLPPPLTPVPER